MFRSPFYHPYPRPPAPSSPAGFRLGDFVRKRRCFNLFRGPDFTDTRSPDPSPLTSPVKGPPTPHDDTPPAVPFTNIRSEDFSPSQRPSIPTPSSRQNVMPGAMPSYGSFPSPRRKHKESKKLSFRKERSGAVPPHRRSQQLKDRREAFRKKYGGRHERRKLQHGRDELVRLRREAEMLMKPEHMNQQDHVFLKQLKDLEFDNLLEHDLERYREEVARATAEGDERRKEQEARDARVERLWAEEQAEEECEDYQRTDSFVQREKEAMEAHFRRLEEEAMREDEKRQRAHQAAERMIRDYEARRYHEELVRKAEEENRRRQEEEERRLREEVQRREREEMARRYREQQRRMGEEIERARREEEARRIQERRRREAEERRYRERKERLDREMREEEARVRAARLEHERILRATKEYLEEERLRAERARRTTEEEQIRQYFAIYEAKWDELRTNTSLPPIGVEEMPWPVFNVVDAADQITAEGVKTFLLHPLRPGVEGKTARDKVKSEVLRFHPDKFNARIIPKIKLSQQAVAQAISGAVARILTALMTEEAEH